MSRSGDTTRATILDAAADLLERHGPAEVTMAAVARAAGVSRQAVYLHFAGRTQLMLAVIDQIGLRHGVGSFRADAAEGTPRERLELALRVWARYVARIHHVALALDVARHTDAAAADAWNDRAAMRRANLRPLVAELATQGGLAAGWSVDAVTDALEVLCSPRTYTDLVTDRHRGGKAYERFLLQAASGFLNDSVT